MTRKRSSPPSARGDDVIQTSGSRKPTRKKKNRRKLTELVVAREISKTLKPVDVTDLGLTETTFTHLGCNEHTRTCSWEASVGDRDLHRRYSVRYETVQSSSAREEMVKATEAHRRAMFALALEANLLRVQSGHSKVRVPSELGSPMPAPGPTPNTPLHSPKAQELAMRIQAYNSNAISAETFKNINPY